MEKITLLTFFEVVSSTVKCWVSSTNTISALGLQIPNLFNFSPQLQNVSLRKCYCHNSISKLRFGRKTFSYGNLYLFLLVSFCGITMTTAQTFPPASSCTSKDLSLVNATMPSTPCETCTPGDIIIKPLTLFINNKTGSTRTSFAFWATLTVINSDGTIDVTNSGPIFRCFGPPLLINGIPKNATTPFLYGNIVYKCGQSLKLTNIWEAWTDASPGATCPVLQANTLTINPKCGTLPVLNIIAGLDATLDITSANCNNTGGSITVTPQGGLPNYSITLVKVGSPDIIRTGIITSTTFSSLASGQYTINIKDANDCPLPVQKTPTVGLPNVSDPPTVITPVVYCQNSTASILTATGTSLLWYSLATGGTGSSTAPTPSTSMAGNTSYWVSQTSLSKCESPRSQIVVTVNVTPAAPTSGGDKTQCEQSPIQTLTATATGGTITWYDAAIGGNLVGSPTKNATGSVTYYAQTSNGTCSSLTRTAVTLTINSAPAAPTSGGDKTQCEQSPIQTLTATATGGTITWYDAATGGNLVGSPTKNTTGSVTYYAQTSNGTCSSLTRTAVTLTINAAPGPPTSGGDKTQCEQSPIQTLTATATGGTITWYDAPTGGNLVESPTKNTTGLVIYYAQASNGTCSSLTRTAVTLTINAAPAVPTSGGDKTQCEQSPIQTLTAAATGGTITWYDAATGGNLVGSPTKNTTGSVTYYAQASNGTCLSLTRTAVTLTINAAPAVPTSGGDKTQCEQSPIQTLTATAIGGTITWYDAATGGNLVGSPTTNITGSVTYYAQASNGTCSSLTRTAVTLAINAVPIAPTFCVVQPSLCSTAKGSVTINSPCGVDYEYSIKNGDAGTWQSAILFANLNPGDVTGIRVRNKNTACISNAASCEVPNCSVSPCPSTTGKIASTDNKTIATAAPILAKTATVGFDAYPVPFKDQLTIKYNFDYVSDVKIEVFDAQGIPILSKTDTNGYFNKEVALDLKLNRQRDQVLVVKVTTNRGSSVKKVISSR